MSAKDPQQRAAQNRRYYERGGKAKIQAHNKATKERNRLYVIEFKRDRPCLDCGKTYPHYVMEFDHIGDDKEATISRLVYTSVSLARLRAEIAKCELVCANCHRERTWQRMVADRLVG